MNINEHRRLKREQLSLIRLRLRLIKLARRTASDELAEVLGEVESHVRQAEELLEAAQPPVPAVEPIEPILLNALTAEQELGLQLLARTIEAERGDALASAAVVTKAAARQLARVTVGR